MTHTDENTLKPYHYKNLQYPVFTLGRDDREERARVAEYMDTQARKYDHEGYPLEHPAQTHEAISDSTA